MMTLLLAANSRLAQQWANYEDDQDDADMIERLEQQKYEEIRKDASDMEKAVIWFSDQSHENADLVERTYHALDLASCGKDMAKIFEAAQGIADMRDKAASMYAKHLVEREFID